LSESGDKKGIHENDKKWKNGRWFKLSGMVGTI